MDRRRFLKITAFITFSIASNAKSNPAVVAATLTVASVVLSLMKKSGPNITDLINLNTQMLRVISDQINTMSKFLIEIKEELSEINDKILKIPEDVDFRIKLTNLIGLNQNISDRIAIFRLDKSKLGPEKAYDIHLQSLINLREQIIGQRFSLAGNYSNFHAIPTMCLSLVSEFSISIITLESLGKNAIASSLEYYELYFKKQLDVATINGAAYEIDRSLVELRDLRSKFLANRIERTWKENSTGERFPCAYEPIGIPFGGGPGNTPFVLPDVTEWGELHKLHSRYASYTYTTMSPSDTEVKSNELYAQIFKLYNQGIITKEMLPVKISVSEIKSASVSAAWCSEGFKIFDGGFQDADLLINNNEYDEIQNVIRRKGKDSATIAFENNLNNLKNMHDSIIFRIAGLRGLRASSIYALEKIKELKNLLKSMPE